MELNYSHIHSLEDSIHGIEVDLGDYGLVSSLRAYSGDEMDSILLNRTRDGISNPYTHEGDIHDPGFHVWDRHEIQRGKYIVHVHSQWKGLLRDEWMDSVKFRC